MRLRGGDAKSDAWERSAEEERELARRVAEIKAANGMPPHTILVPDDYERVYEAVEEACGRMIHYGDYPEPDPDGYVEPAVNEYGQGILVEWLEWKQGLGQPVFVRWGIHDWGRWSERRQTWKHPMLIVVRGRLYLKGEDGTILCGQWMFLDGSSGVLSHMMLKTEHFRPGMGGGLCLHFDGGNWTVQNCQLRVRPAPMITCVGVSNRANVTLDWCLLSRQQNCVPGAWGYGIFAWGKAPRVTCRNLTLTELKVGVDAGDGSAVSLAGCTFRHNRVGVYMRCDAEVSVDDCDFSYNHKGCFHVGRPAQGTTRLRVRDTRVKACAMWGDADRPGVLEEANVTVNETGHAKVYDGTGIPIPGVEGGAGVSRRGGEMLRYRRDLLFNATALHPSREPADWDMRKAWDLPEPLGGVADSEEEEDSEEGQDWFEGLGRGWHDGEEMGETWHRQRRVFYDTVQAVFGGLDNRPMEQFSPNPPDTKPVKYTRAQLFGPNVEEYEKYVRPRPGGVS